MLLLDRSTVIETDNLPPPKTETSLFYKVNLYKLDFRFTSYALLRSYNQCKKKIDAKKSCVHRVSSTKQVTDFINQTRTLRVSRSFPSLPHSHPSTSKSFNSNLNFPRTIYYWRPSYIVRRLAFLLPTSRDLVLRKPRLILSQYKFSRKIPRKGAFAPIAPKAYPQAM